MRSNEISSSMVIELLKYLVCRRLAEPWSIYTIYDYFIIRLSPSEIEEKYNITKAQVKNYVWQTLHKVDYNFLIARNIVGCAFPYLVEIQPIFENNGNCRLCKYDVGFMRFQHIMRKHKKDVDKYVNNILPFIEIEINNRLHAFSILP